MRNAVWSVSRYAKLVQPHDLALAHHHAAEELRGIFGGADLREQRLHLAEAAFVRHAAGIARHLAQRLDIGRDPGKAVRGVLLALERLAVDLAALADLGGDGVAARSRNLLAASAVERLEAE